MALTLRKQDVVALTVCDYAYCGAFSNSFSFGAYYFAGFAWRSYYYYFSKLIRIKGRRA